MYLGKCFSKVFLFHRLVLIIDSINCSENCLRYEVPCQFGRHFSLVSRLKAFVSAQYVFNFTHFTQR